MIKKGKFGVYILTKKGWNTVDALRRLAVELKIPYRSLSYGGKKDRHAVTTQYITIQGERQDSVKLDQIGINFVGYMDRPMGPDLIVSNAFDIMVRGLDKNVVSKAVKEVELVCKGGYPNYFDDQRFGSYDPQGGFIAEKILKGHLNGAAKILLTAIHPEDKSVEKKRKRFFFEHWQQWDLCQAEAYSGFEKRMFELLARKDYQTMLLTIPQDDLSLYISAFQSYVWNETVKRLVLKIAGDEIASVKGVVNDYVFFKHLDKISYAYLKKMTIPLMAHNAQMPDKKVELIYQAILKEREISKTLFNKLKIRHAFFKAHRRDVIIRPQGLEFEMFDDALRLRFSLGKGAYATTLIKRIFATL